MEPVDRIRLGRAPHMKYKYLLGDGVQYVGRALEYSRRVAKETDCAGTRGVQRTRGHLRSVKDFVRAVRAAQ